VHFEPNFNFGWHRYTFALIKMDTATSTFFHDLQNSMSLPTNSLPKYSRTSEQLISQLSSTHYPHAESISVMAQGTSQAAKSARSQTNSLSTESERTSNSATVVDHSRRDAQNTVSIRAGILDITSSFINTYTKDLLHP
jgi:hypothetical protein